MRKGNSYSTKGNSNAKKQSKLNKLAAATLVDDYDYGEEQEELDPSLVWKHGLFACGSNAFGQTSGKDSGILGDFSSIVLYNDVIFLLSNAESYDHQKIMINR